MNVLRVFSYAMVANNPFNPLTDGEYMSGEVVKTGAFGGGFALARMLLRQKTDGGITNGQRKSRNDNRRVLMQGASLLGIAKSVCILTAGRW